MQNFIIKKNLQKKLKFPHYFSILEFLYVLFCFFFELSEFQELSRAVQILF